MTGTNDTRKGETMTLSEIVNGNLIERERAVSLTTEGIRLVADHLGISTIAELKGEHLGDIALACEHQKRFAAPKTDRCIEAGLD